MGAAAELTGDDLDVVFDNGGGITVQARGFVHGYSDAKQAARDVKNILAADYDPTNWEGDEPTCYAGAVADPEIERNNGYRWMSRQEIKTILDKGEISNCWNWAMSEFFCALGVTVTDDHYAPA